MTFRIRSASTALLVGQLWGLLVEAEELPVLVVTKPDGTTLTPAVTFEITTPWDWDLPYATYGYRAELVVTAAGRWLAAVQVGSVLAGVAQAEVRTQTASAALPDAASLDDWLGGPDTHSWPTEKLEEKIAIALQKQREVCRVPAAYPETLREAAHRRAARLLVMERQLTDQPRTDGDFDTPAALPPGRDFSTRELEAGYRRLPIG